MKITKYIKITFIFTFNTLEALRQPQVTLHLVLNKQLLPHKHC